MEFLARTCDPVKQRTGCVVVGIFAGRRLSASAKSINEASGGALLRIVRRGDIDGKTGRTLLVHGLSGVLADRVLLVGCGDAKGMDETRYQKIIGKAAASLAQTGAREAVVSLTELEVAGRDVYWKIRHALERFEFGLYRFNQLKTKDEDKKASLLRIIFCMPGRKDLRLGSKAVQDGTAIAGAVAMARDLGNLPGNICTPSYLADRAQELGRTYDTIRTRTLGQKDMEKLGMGTLLSVARGSRQPPKLIILRYPGTRKKAKPVVLVGKGVTFDSGGISIKPAAAMDEMKFDMCGAASVLAAVKFAADLALPVGVVGLVPATENLPDGNASKPGDVVTSMSGQTVEILNTDAEGRLILSDTLTYAARFDPDVVIDVATLTGACVVALGSHASGLFANHQPLADTLLAAGKYAGDLAWQLPLWDDYQDQIKSNFADMANVGGRHAGAITAACFLSRFTKSYRWAHLDIAGSAWNTGTKKGATGRPVSLLAQYLIDRSRAN